MPLRRRALRTTITRCLAAAALAAACCPSPARGESADERRLVELRRQRQFEQAEQFGVERLADAALPADVRRALSIELSRTFAQHALESPAPQRPELWQAAQRLVDEFAARHPGDPRLVLVRMQGALVALAEGTALREEAELDGNSASELAAAREALRRAVKQLHELRESVAAEARQRGREPAQSSAALTLAELSSLEINIRYQLATALRHQGLCYPADSADRVNSLGQAVELLSALTRHEMTPQMEWSVRLDEIAALRLFGNTNAAEQRLAAADRLQPPADVASRMKAERIRIALARGRVDEALSEAGAPGAKAAGSTSESADAQLEAYLAGWRRARHSANKPEASRWEQAAIEQVRAIQQSGSAANARRAETRLARTMAGADGSENPQVLLLAAQSLYRAGRLDEAQAAYEAASKQAARVGDKATYFDSQYAAGALEFERQQFAGAVARLRQLAMTLPQHARAPAAHLLAIHAAAQVARAQNPPRLEQYKELLDEHVAAWPGDETASQAWWWLGRLNEHNRSWQEAVRALKNVKRDHENYADAVAAIGHCYEAALDELRDRGNANELLANDAIAYLQEASASARRASPPNAAAARAATLAMARIHLKETSGGPREAERLLADALRSDAGAPPQWRRQAQTLLVPALAATGRAAAAEDLLRQMPIGTAAEGVALTNLLAAVKQRTTSDDKRAVAGIELAVIADVLARPQQLDEATIKELTNRRVITLAELGQREQALAELRTLAAQFPRDGQLQEGLAQLLADGGDVAGRQAAAAKWREVASHCRPGSDRWFRAHLALARLQLELGDAAQARTTIRLVEASQPDMGGPEMKAQFRQLQAESGRASD